MHNVNIAHVSIGVADMSVALQLWVGQLGLSVIARRDGPDTALAALWGIPESQIVDQVLLGTPAAPGGYLHFVQFAEPAAAVRRDAAPTDFGAKNIDVNCVHMAGRVEQLTQAGYKFRSAISEYEIDGIRAREVQMPVHDAINLVLIEVLSDGFAVNYTEQGFAALTSFVVIVPDAEREALFYKNLFGMETILAHTLSSPAIEQAAGLPAGTELSLQLLGAPDNLFGRMELIQYTGVQGANCFARAVPPATGILRCGFRVASLTDFEQLAAQQNVTITRDLQVNTLFGQGRLLELASPAGLRLEVMQQ